MVTRGRRQLPKGQRQPTKGKGPRQRKPVRGQNRGSGDNRLLVPACVPNYGLALLNPFDGPITCVPDGPVIATEKRRQWARGSFVTSATTNVGFVTLAPYKIASDDNISDSCFVAYTNLTTFAGSAIDRTTATGLAYLPSNGPYLDSNVGSDETDVQFRIVAAGLRCKNITALLDRGGKVIGLTQPAHETLDGYDEAKLLAVAESGYFSGSDEGWVTIVAKPGDIGDFGFSKATASDGAGVAVSNYMALMAVAPASKPQTYAFEAYVVVEYTGAPATAKTPGESSPEGVARLLSHLSGTEVANKPTQEVGRTRQTKNFMSDLTKLFKVAGPMVLQGLAMVL